MCGSGRRLRIVFRSQVVKIGIVGSYVPRRCGIATFSNHLAKSIAENVYRERLSNGGPVRIVAVNDRDGAYQYGTEVMAEIGQHHREDYRIAADALNIGKIDAVILQHEYGLFGVTAANTSSTCCTACTSHWWPPFTPF